MRYKSIYLYFSKIMNKARNVHSPELTKGSLLVTNTIWNTEIILKEVSTKGED